MFYYNLLNPEEKIYGDFEGVQTDLTYKVTRYGQTVHSEMTVCIRTYHDNCLRTLPADAVFID